MTSPDDHRRSSSARRPQSRAGGRPTRRRGAEVEEAVLDATWQELCEHGYADLTFDAVAARAGTSRTVLYRRWSSRHDLAEAAILRQHSLRRPELPDTGNLRDDLVQHITNVIAAQADLVAVASFHLAAYFSERNGSRESLRQSVRAQTGTPQGVSLIFLRAQQRGEINLTGVPQIVLEVPFDLAWALMMEMRLPTAEDISQIIDQIFLPLLRAYGALPPGQADPAATT